MALAVPQQGEVWFAVLDPTVGSDVRKTRPVVVLTADAANRAPMRVSLCAPTTTTPQPTGVRLELTDDGGVLRVSYAMAIQTRALSHDRLTRRIGRMPDAALAELHRTLTVLTRPGFS